MMIDGIVEQGKHLGRRLGYPTANIAPRRTEGAWPPNGVYAAAVWIGGDGRAWPGMLNQGVHPTAPEGVTAENIRTRFGLRISAAEKGLDVLKNALTQDDKKD